MTLTHDFLNGHAELPSAPSSELLDAIVAAAVGDAHPYFAQQAAASFFAVCGQRRLEAVLEGRVDPERFSQAMVTSPLPDAWLLAFAARLGTLAKDGKSTRSLLAALCAVVGRGLPLAADLQAHAARWVSSAYELSTKQVLLAQLSVEARGEVLVADFEWALVAPPASPTLLAKIAAELESGSVDAAQPVGRFGGVALSALLRLGREGVDQLCSAHAVDRGASAWLVREARHYLEPRPRTGPLAALRARVADTLFAEEHPDQEETVSGRALMDLWGALSPERSSVMLPQHFPYLVGTGVAAPQAGKWLVAPPDHPLFLLVWREQQLASLHEMGAPELIVSAHTQWREEARVAFDTAPRHNELEYVDRLPVGYRRALELVRRTLARMASRCDASDTKLSAPLDELARCESSGPRLWSWEELSLDDEEEASPIQRIGFAALRLLQELGVAHGRDGERPPVELELAYQMLFAIEGDEPSQAAEQRPAARELIDAWLDEDVPPAALLG